LLGVSGQIMNEFESVQYEEISLKRLKVMTFNLRTDTSLDNLLKHPWSTRRVKVVELILRHKPDIVCTQEGLISQLEYIISNTDGLYSWFGAPRGSVLSPDEHCAIFYRRDKFTLIDHETFWLSETPSKPGSVFGNTGSIFGTLASMTTIPRIATWGKLRICTSECEITNEGAGFAGSEICVVSTHWGLSQHLRLRSVDVLNRELRTRLGHANANINIPTVICGDFNDRRYSQVWNKMTSPAAGGTSPGWTDAWINAHKKDGHSSPTFHAYMGMVGGYKDGAGHIDWILHNSLVKSAAVHVIHTETNKEDSSATTHPSDHYPILSELLLL